MVSAGAGGGPGPRLEPPVLMLHQEEEPGEITQRVQLQLLRQLRQGQRHRVRVRRLLGVLRLLEALRREASARRRVRGWLVRVKKALEKGWRAQV